MRATAEVALATENETLPQGSSTQSIVSPGPVEDASLPSAPFTPNYTRNLAVGALVGILLGYVAAFVRMNLDRKLRSVEEVEELIETPVLAILPEVKDLNRKQAKGSTAPTADPPPRLSASCAPTSGSSTSTTPSEPW